MAYKITKEKFVRLSEDDRREYVRAQLHLEYYPQLIPTGGAGEEDAEERLIARVKRVGAEDGSSRYDVYPIDCLDKDGGVRRGALFEEFEGGFPVPDTEERSVNAAALACQANISGWGSRVAACTYDVTEDEQEPIRITDVRVLNYSLGAMKDRISGLYREKKVQLTTEIEELQQVLAAGQERIQRKLEAGEAELEERRKGWAAERADIEQQRSLCSGEVDKLSARAEQLRREQKKADKQLHQAETAAAELKAQAQDFAGRLSALGVDLDLKKLGLTPPQPKTRKPSQRQPKQIPDLRKQAGLIRTDLAKQDGLHYEEHVIREFLGALASNQIIVLSGPPGTGKSSLPQAIARHIRGEYIGPECAGVVCRMVSVQPSWTDNQDLLGFYDPTRERFVPTPFMDILVEAGEHRDTVYLVCLDEMNLVKVEYYFSELLSAMELENKALRLYSPFVYKQRSRALARRFDVLRRQVEQGEQGAVEELNAVIAAQEMLNRYPAEFPVPDNVHFVGTLNMDESTKGLSPKVLDRSFIIEIHRDGGEAAPEAPPEDPAEQRLEDLLALQKKLEDLERDYTEHKVHAALSARGMAHATALLEAGLDLDDVFLGKILPAMRYTDLEKEGLDSLARYLERQDRPGRLKKGRLKLEQIYDPEFKELNYWR